MGEEAAVVDLGAEEEQAQQPQQRQRQQQQQQQRSVKEDGEEERGGLAVSDTEQQGASGRNPPPPPQEQQQQVVVVEMGTWIEARRAEAGLITVEAQQQVAKNVAVGKAEEQAVVVAVEEQQQQGEEEEEVAELAEELVVVQEVRGPAAGAAGHSHSHSWSKGKEVICISDDSDSDSSIRHPRTPAQGFAARPRPACARAGVKAESAADADEDAGEVVQPVAAAAGASAAGGGGAPVVPKVECVVNRQQHFQAHAHAQAQWREAPAGGGAGPGVPPPPLRVPKAEVIYGGSGRGLRGAACRSREAAQAQVTAQWGHQLAHQRGPHNQQQQQQQQVGGGGGSARAPPAGTPPPAGPPPPAADGTPAEPSPFAFPSLPLALVPTPLAIRDPNPGPVSSAAAAAAAGAVPLASPSTPFPPGGSSSIGRNPNIRTTHEGHRRPAVTVGSYTVQCSLCDRWRWLPNKQVYERIRELSPEVPFRCQYAARWAPGSCCAQPAEVAAGDVGFVWAMDKARIARPPPGWERKVVVRGEGSLIFSDVYYLTPDGRTLRSMNDIVKFLADHPEEDVSLAQFNFSRPNAMDAKVQKRRRLELLGAVAGSSGDSPPHKLLRTS